MISLTHDNNYVHNWYFSFSTISAQELFSCEYFVFTTRLLVIFFWSLKDLEYKLGALTVATIGILMVGIDTRIVIVGLP